jgi:hypothetical protein
MELMVRARTMAYNAAVWLTNAGAALPLCQAAAVLPGTLGQIHEILPRFMVKRRICE